MPQAKRGNSLLVVEFQQGEALGEKAQFFVCARPRQRGRFWGEDDRAEQREQASNLRGSNSDLDPQAICADQAGHGEQALDRSQLATRHQKHGGRNQEGRAQQDGSQTVQRLSTRGDGGNLFQ